MIDKRTILATSIAASIVAHGVLFVVAPRVEILGRPADTRDRLARFKVQLVDDALVRGLPGNADDSLQNLATRPGAIEDILTGEDETLAPAEPTQTDVPRMTERLIHERIPLPPAPEPDESVLQSMDTKIIEIAEVTAREDVQVARRLVEPSSGRIVPEETDPVLRSPFDPGLDEVLFIDPLQPGSGMGGFGGVVQGEGGEGGPGGEPAPSAMEPLTIDRQPITELPELSVDRDIARTRIREEILENRPYDAIDDFVEMRLDTYVPPGEPEGYFRLRIVPKEDSTLDVLPKDATFVIDASSSILQRKLDETVEGVRALVAGLREQDYFNVVIFRDNPAQFQSQPVPATPENKQAARAFIDDLQARGETDLYQAMQPVVLTPPRFGIPGIVMVVSDGRPTKGIRDAREIINALTQENALRNSIFAFSGGRTVNQFMLDLLAYRNKGECMVVPEIEAMSGELQTFFGQLADPLLVDCRADYGRIDEAAVFPKNLPDFYRGQAVTVYGRFDPGSDDTFAIRLTGLAADAKKEAVFRADLNDAQTGDADIARMWAFRKIYDLIGEIVRVGEDPALLAELRELSRAYNIRTSYD